MRRLRAPLVRRGLLAVPAVTLGLAALGGVVYQASASVRSDRLTAATADADLRNYVRATTPNAVFPSAQGVYCPGSYITGPTPKSTRGPAAPIEAQCIVEYHVGATWSSLAGTVALVNGAVHVGILRLGPGRFDYAGFYSRGTWQRKWAVCSRPKWATGTLDSNNACGDHTYGGDDWYFVSQMYVPTFLTSGKVRFQFQPSAELAWDWTDSAGYRLGAYFGGKRGGAYTYTDVVGDSFRYTP